MGYWNDGVCSSLHFLATHQICILQLGLSIYLAVHVEYYIFLKQEKLLGDLTKNFRVQNLFVGFGGGVMERPISPETDACVWDVTKTAPHHVSLTC